MNDNQIATGFHRSDARVTLFGLWLPYNACQRRRDTKRHIPIRLLLMIMNTKITRIIGPATNFICRSSQTFQIAFRHTRTNTKPLVSRRRGQYQTRG